MCVSVGVLRVRVCYGAKERSSRVYVMVLSRSRMRQVGASLCSEGVC